MRVDEKDYSTRWIVGRGRSHLVEVILSILNVTIVCIYMYVLDT